MTKAQGIHIDQQAFSVLQHHILQVIIPVHHMHILRNSIDQRIKLIKQIFRQIILEELRPIQRNGFHIRHGSGFDDLGMDELEHIDTHGCDLIQGLFPADQELCVAFCIEQLINGAVTAAFDTDHIKRNGSGHSEDKSGPGKLPLPVDLLDGVFVQENFYDGIPVDAVDLPVGALSDDLTAFHGNNTVCLFNRHHFGKTGHIKNFIHIGMDIDQPCIIYFLFEAQDHTESGTGGEIQFVAIQNDCFCSEFLPELIDLRLNIRRIQGINFSR